MRILFPLHGYIGWNGGLDLVRFHTAAITTQLRPGLELHFAMPQSTVERRWLLAALRCWQRLRAGVSQRAVPDTGSEAALRRIAHEIIEGHPVDYCTNDATGILDVANRVRADVVFPTMLPLGSTGPARVGYLFDFQHRRLPHMFASRTIRNRDRQFARIAKDANLIVVNSQVVANEANEFLGVPPERLLVLPFTPYVEPWWFDSSIDEVLLRYSVKSPYFLICNHFWAHKDHATALRALALLLHDEEDKSVNLVLTGDPIDHRDPGHYAKLVALTRDLGIENRVRFLGLIPKRDQLSLMRGCQALIQPTLFEGGPGGGSVIEAIGLGTPVVASDITINREINIGDVAFFRAGDPYSLSEQMSRVLNACRLTRMPDELLKASAQRLEILGARIVDHLTHLAV